MCAVGWGVLCFLSSGLKGRGSVCWKIQKLLENKIRIEKKQAYFVRPTCCPFCALSALPWLSFVCPVLFALLSTRCDHFICIVVSGFCVARWRHGGFVLRGGCVLTCRIWW